MENERKDKLYNALVGKGFQFDGREGFDTCMADSATARRIYDTAKKHGFQFDEFDPWYKEFGPQSAAPASEPAEQNDAIRRPDVSTIENAPVSVRSRIAEAPAANNATSESFNQFANQMRNDPLGLKAKQQQQFNKANAQGLMEAQQRVEFDKLYKPALEAKRQEYANAAREANSKMPTVGSSSVTGYNAGAAMRKSEHMPLSEAMDYAASQLTPESISKYFANVYGEDYNSKSEDEKKQLASELANQISQDVFNDYVKTQKVDGDADAILRSMADSLTFRVLSMMSGQDKYEAEAERQARAAYLENAGGATKFAAEFTPMIVDVFAMKGLGTGGGFIGQQVSNGAASLTSHAMRMLGSWGGKTVTNDVALRWALQNSAVRSVFSKYLPQLVSGTWAMGNYNLASTAADKAQSVNPEDKLSFSDVLNAYKSGAMFSLFGGVGGHLASAATEKAIAGTAGRILGFGAELGAEGSYMTWEDLNRQAEEARRNGEDAEWYNMDWSKAAGHGFGMALAFKAQGIIQEPGMFKARMTGKLADNNGLKWNTEWSDKLKDMGYDGYLLDFMDGKRVGDLGGDNRSAVESMEWQFNDIMGNENVPVEIKRALAYVATGKITPTGHTLDKDGNLVAVMDPMQSVTAIVPGQRNGKFVARGTDPLGLNLFEREFNTEKEMMDYVMKQQKYIEDNNIRYAENFAGSLDEAEYSTIMAENLSPEETEAKMQEAAKQKRDRLVEQAKQNCAGGKDAVDAALAKPFEKRSDEEKALIDAYLKELEHAGQTPQIRAVDEATDENGMVTFAVSNEDNSEVYAIKTPYNSDYVAILYPESGEKKVVRATDITEIGQESAEEVLGAVTETPEEAAADQKAIAAAQQQQAAAETQQKQDELRQKQADIAAQQKQQHDDATFFVNVDGQWMPAMDAVEEGGRARITLMDGTELEEPVDWMNVKAGDDFRAEEQQQIDAANAEQQRLLAEQQQKDAEAQRKEQERIQKEQESKAKAEAEAQKKAEEEAAKKAADEKTATLKNLGDQIKTSPDEKAVADVEAQVNQLAEAGTITPGEARVFENQIKSKRNELAEKEKPAEKPATEEKPATKAGLKGLPFGSNEERQARYESEYKKADKKFPPVKGLGKKAAQALHDLEVAMEAWYRTSNKYLGGGSNDPDWLALRETEKQFEKATASMSDKELQIIADRGKDNRTHSATSAALAEISKRRYDAFNKEHPSINLRGLHDSLAKLRRSSDRPLYEKALSDFAETVSRLNNDEQNQLRQLVNDNGDHGTADFSWFSMHKDIASAIKKGIMSNAKPTSENITSGADLTKIEQERYDADMKGYEKPKAILPMGEQAWVDYVKVLKAQAENLEKEGKTESAASIRGSVRAAQDRFDYMKEHGTWNEKGVWKESKKPKSSKPSSEDEETSKVDNNVFNELESKGVKSGAEVSVEYDGNKITGKITGVGESVSKVKTADGKTEYVPNELIINSINKPTRETKTNGLVENEGSKQLDEATRNLLDTMGSQTGRKVEVADLPEGCNGLYDPVTNTIFIADKIAKDGSNSVRWAMGHETTHMLKNENPELWKPFRSFVKTEMGDAWDLALDDVKDRYAKAANDPNLTEEMRKAIKNMTEEEFEEEVLADWAGSHVLSDEKFVKKMLEEAENVGTDAPGLIKKFMAAIDRMIANIRKAITGKENAADIERLKALEGAKKIWGQMYDVAVAKHNAAVEKMNDGESLGKKKMSIRDLEKDGNPDDPEWRKKNGIELRDAYKLMRLTDDGKLQTLYIGRETYELGNWYNGDSPDLSMLENLEQDYFHLFDENNNVVDKKPIKYGKNNKISGLSPAEIKQANDNSQRWMAVGRYADGGRKYANMGINGSEGVTDYALRPGIHAGSEPSMQQIASGSREEKAAMGGYRDDNLVWVKGKVLVGLNDQEMAELSSKGEIQSHIPSGGYIKGTSSFVTKGMDWFITNAFKPEQIISDKDAMEEIDRANANPELKEKIPYDHPRRNGRLFNAETMKLEDAPNDVERMVEKEGVSEKVASDLESKGLTAKDGVVVNKDAEKLMEETGYKPLPPDGPKPKIRLSYGTKDRWKESYLGVDSSKREEVVARHIDNWYEAAAADDLTSEYMNYNSYPSSGLNQDGKGPLRSNMEYRFTFDLDTTCPRTFQYLNYAADAEKYLGRPLDQREAVLLIEKMRANGQMIPCVYCYAENKRQALKQYFLNFMNARNGVLSAKSEEEAFAKMYGHDGKGLTAAAQKVYDRWRGQDDELNKYNPNINQLVHDHLRAKSVVMGLLDSFGIDPANTPNKKIVERLCKELGIEDNDANKGVITQLNNEVIEWRYDMLEGRKHKDVLPMDEDDLFFDSNDRNSMALWDQMTKYGKSASSAKNSVRYHPYTDELQKLSADDKAFVNGMGGLRMHSTNDFRIDYVGDYFQLIADMAKHGFMGHTYTKSPEFVEIFGNTGYRINMSIAAYDVVDKDGNVHVVMNQDEGHNWDTAKRLREQSPNAGTMFMTTSAAQLQYALDADWVDMIIPFHSSGLPKEIWYDMRRWEDAQSNQNEAYLNSNEMKERLAKKGIDTKDMSTEDVEKLFFKTFKIVPKKYDAKGKVITPHFLPGGGNGWPAHGNSAEKYFELCEKYGVRPRFYGTKVKDKNGNEIDVTEHPNYFKLIKETARDTKQSAVKFNLDKPNPNLSIPEHTKIVKDKLDSLDKKVADRLRNMPGAFMDEKKGDLYIPNENAGGNKTPLEYAMWKLREFAGQNGYEGYKKDEYGVVNSFIEDVLKHEKETGEKRPVDWMSEDDKMMWSATRGAILDMYGVKGDLTNIPYHPELEPAESTELKRREGETYREFAQRVLDEYDKARAVEKPTKDTWQPLKKEKEESWTEFAQRVLSKWDSFKNENNPDDDPTTPSGGGGGRKVKLSLGNAPRSAAMDAREAKLDAMAAQSVDDVKQAYTDMMAKQAGKLDTVEGVKQAAKDITEFVQSNINTVVADNLSSARIKSLITQIRRATTKQELEAPVKAVEQIINDAQIKAVQKRLDKTLDAVLQKKNDRGVLIANRVDDEMRIVFDSVRNEYKKDTMTSTSFDAAVAKSSKEASELRGRISALWSGKPKPKDAAGFNAATNKPDPAYMARLQAELKAKETEMRNNMRMRVDELNQAIEKELNDLDTDRINTDSEIGQCVTDGVPVSEDLAFHRLISIPMKEAAIEVRNAYTDLENARNEWQQELAILNGIKRAPGYKAIKTAQQARVKALEEAYMQAQEKAITATKVFDDNMRYILKVGHDRLKQIMDKEVDHKKLIINSTLGDVKHTRVLTEGQEKSLGRKLWNGLQKVDDSLLNAPLWSADFALQMMDYNHANGEGFAYKYFMKDPETGLVAANDRMADGRKAFGDALDNKVSEIFGIKHDKLLDRSPFARLYHKAQDDLNTPIKRLMTTEEAIKETKRLGGREIDQSEADMNNILNKDGRSDWKEGDKVPFEEGDEYTVEHMTKGHALYLWLTWRQTDGKMKMARMGYTDEAMAAIENALGPEYIKLGEWMTEEFLPKMWAEKYLPKYEQMYHTTIPMTPHYFPLKIDRESLRTKGGIDQMSKQFMVSTVTPAIIQRTRNTAKIDPTADAFEVIQRYGEMMEQWHAMAKVIADFNTLHQSYAIKENMEANHEGSFRTLMKAAQVATGSLYDMGETKEMKAAKALLSKSISTGAKAAIGFRFNTALKQMLSYPAFYAYKGDAKFYAELTANNPLLGVGLATAALRGGDGKLLEWRGTHKWAMEHLPSYRQRVREGDMGLEGMNDETFFDGIFSRRLGRLGMSANRAIDTMTIAAGARAVYNCAMRKAEAMGMTPEQAEAYAVTEAEIAYNQSQQSSRAEFSSEMQKNSDSAIRSLLMFQNANIGYQRQIRLAAWDIYKAARMAKDNGFMETAKRIGGAAVNIGTFGAVLPMLWYLGGHTNQIYQWASGDGLSDEDEKGLWTSFWTGMLTNGTTYGAPISAWSSGWSYDLFPLMNDFYDAFINDRTSASKMQLWQYAAKYGIGYNHETWTNIFNGLGEMYDYYASDEKRPGADLLMGALLFINNPKSDRRGWAQQMYTKYGPVEYAKAWERASQVQHSDRTAANRVDEYIKRTNEDFFNEMQKIKDLEKTYKEASDEEQKAILESDEYKALQPYFDNGLWDTYNSLLVPAMRANIRKLNPEGEPFNAGKGRGKLKADDEALQKELERLIDQWKEISNK